MAEQPSTSTLTAATAAARTMIGLTKEELALVKCLNQKEVIEYEAQLKKLIVKAVKRFHRGQDLKEDDVALDMVYPTLVHDVKVLVKTMYEDMAKANQKEIIQMVTNADGQCIWDPDIMTNDDNDDDGEEVQI